MDVIVCYTKCYPCQFGEHPPNPHTWMATDDLEHEGMPVPSTPEGWAALAAERPCGCYCMRVDEKGVAQ